LIAISFVAVGVAALHAVSRRSPWRRSAAGSTRRSTAPTWPASRQSSRRPSLPWGSSLSWHLVRDLLPSAFAIAMLGAIESLLSAVIADGMTGTKHDPNSELVGLGIGNLLAPIFGGIAATGALARTAPTSARGPALVRRGDARADRGSSRCSSWRRWSPTWPMASLAALLLLVA